MLAGFYAVYVGLYMYCLWRSSYQERMVRIQLTCLSPPYLYPCRGLVVFSGFRGEVIVRFVDIGGIDDHLYLNFLFININRLVLLLVVHSFGKNKPLMFDTCYIFSHQSAVSLVLVGFFWSIFSFLCT